MTHFGIICPPFPGHLNPLAALGRELRSRNHCVTFLQIPDIEPIVRSEGLNFYPIGQSIYKSGSLAKNFEQLGKLNGIEALRYSVSFCQQLAAIICQDAPGVIEAAGIDALLVDQLEPTGETVAELLGIPFVGVSCGQFIHRQADIPPFFTPWSYQNTWWARLRNQAAYYLLDRSCQPILQVINHYRQEWKLPPYQNYYTSCATPVARISQQPAAFDFPCTNLPKYFHYTGPFRNSSPRKVDFPFERLTGQPLIYASLGSVQNTKHEIFDCIAAACEGLDVQLVITHGGGMKEGTVEKLPGSPLVVEYAPQVEVLALASLTITHGGLNTVLDSLSYGVPLVAIPITYEQPGTGARISWTGTGEVIPLSCLSVSKLRTTIEKVLTEDFYSKNALKLKQDIDQAGGVKRAADIIEQSIRRCRDQRPKMLTSSTSGAKNTNTNLF